MEGAFPNPPFLEVIIATKDVATVREALVEWRAPNTKRVRRAPTFHREARPKVTRIRGHSPGGTKMFFLRPPSREPLAEPQIPERGTPYRTACASFLFFDCSFLFTLLLSFLFADPQCGKMGGS